MPKRPPSPSVSHIATKRAKANKFSPNKIATPQNASAVDANPPLKVLGAILQNNKEEVRKGKCVVYWMRMGDLRIFDNRALSLASASAHKDKIPLVVIFILSPQDYIAHDRAARRVDFTLRNLKLIKESLYKLHIPLHTILHKVRTTIPADLISFLLKISCTNIFANIEYEVDELRRDIKIHKLAREKGIRANFVHDRCVVEPGIVLTKEEKAYAVYTPYQTRWNVILNENLKHYIEDCLGPVSNSPSIKDSESFAHLFSTPVPDEVEGFSLTDEDSKTMATVWPAGEETAALVLQRFINSKARSSQLGAADPLATGSQNDPKNNRLLRYDQDRDHGDRDTTSRLSPYLAAGIISARACIRATMEVHKSEKVDGSRTTAIGRWVQEIAWRDFYTNVLASYPRVSMGRPYLEKYAAIVWEHHATKNGEDTEILRRWKNGTTGVPIIDATMRCLNKMGWVHNRMRMITAMFLTKDLMIDWRVGEKYFMEQLIDGDLSSNNGGWQWSASTGVDPAPYFRIFNPYTQSLKADPSGDFIRTFVPELKSLKNNDVHNPSSGIAERLGYPKPIVKHNEAREVALRRYKTPGEE